MLYMSKENSLIEEIISLSKRRGFVFQSSEIYGGLNGFFDYGPLGVELRKKYQGCMVGRHGSPQG